MKRIYKIIISLVLVVTLLLGGVAALAENATDDNSLLTVLGESDEPEVEVGEAVEDSENPVASAIAPFGTNVTVKFMDQRGVNVEEAVTVTPAGDGSYTFTPPSSTALTLLSFDRLEAGGAVVSGYTEGSAYTGNSSVGDLVFYYNYGGGDLAAGSWMRTDATASINTDNDITGFGFFGHIRYFSNVQNETLDFFASPAPSQSSLGSGSVLVYKLWIPIEDGMYLENLTVSDTYGGGTSTISADVWYSVDPARKEYTRTRPAEDEITSIELRFYNDTAGTISGFFCAVEGQIKFGSNTPSEYLDGTKPIKTGKNGWALAHNIAIADGPDIKWSAGNNGWRIYFTNPEVKGVVKEHDASINPPSFASGTPADGALVELVKGTGVSITVVDSMTTATDGLYSFTKIDTFDDLYVRVTKSGFDSYIIPAQVSSGTVTRGTERAFAEEPISNVVFSDQYYVENNNATSGDLPNMARMEWADNYKNKINDSIRSQVINGQDGKILLVGATPPSEYRVRFIEMGTTDIVLKAVNVTAGGTVASSDIPTTVRPGYSFSGWGLDRGITTPWNPASPVTGALDIYGKWDEVLYDVEFVRADTLASLNSIKVLEGNQVPASAYPSTSMVGYIFTGWTSDQAGANPWVATTAITGDTTVYGHWKAANYTVRFFDAANTATPLDSQTITHGQPISTYPSTVKTGYNFIGWTTDSAGNTPWVSIPITQNTDIYGHWELKTHRVTFVDAANVANVIGTDSVRHGNAVANYPDTTRVGLVFVKWTADQAGNNSWVTTTVITSDTVVYGHWEDAKYTVRFFDAANTATPLDSQTITHGQSVTTYPSTVKTGYNFIGWTTDIAGNTPWADIPITKNTDIYGHWELKTHRVTFVDAANVANVIGTDSVRHGNTVANYPDTTRVGLVFVKWTADQAGNNSWVTTTVITSDTVVYGHWEDAKYTVRFYDVDNLSTPLDSQTITHGQSIATYPSTVKTGYKFIGWTIDIAGNTLWSDIPITKNTDIYGHWEIIKYIVTFSDGVKGTKLGTEEVAAGHLVPNRVNTVRPGYKFLGWYTVRGAVNDAFLWNFETSQMPAKPMALYGYWVDDRGGGRTSSGGYIGQGQSATKADTNVNRSATVQAQTTQATPVSAEKAFTSSIKAKAVDSSAISMKFYNNKKVDFATIAKLTELSEKNKVSLLVHFDTIKDKQVLSRISLSPVGIKSKTDINLELDIKQYTNSMLVETKQKDTFGSQVSIAVKLPDTLKEKDVKVYIYNQQTKVSTPLALGQYWKDGKGYIHFNTVESHSFLVS